MSPSDTAEPDCCRLDIIGESSKLLAKGACAAELTAEVAAGVATIPAFGEASAADSAGMCAEEKPVSTIGST